MGVWRFAIALLIVGLAVRVHADIEESKDWLITERDRNFFARISSENGYSVPPFTKGILVYGRQTGGTFNLLAVGGENIDAKKLAMAVDEWRAASNLEGTVHYSTENDGSAARFKFQANRLFASEARTLIPVRSLIDRLQQLDFEVAPVWYCPPYVETIGHEGTIQRIPKETTTVFDFRRRSPELFEVISRVQPTSYWAIAGIMLVIPLAGLIGLKVGSLQAHRHDLDIEERKKRFSRIFFSCLFGSFALHFPLMVATFISGTTNELADVWLGATRATSLMMPLVFLGIFGIFPIIAGVGKLEARLFATPRPADAAVDARAEEIRKALGKGGRVWNFLAFIFGVVLIAASFRVGSKSDLQLPLRMAGMALFFLAPLAISKWTLQNIPLPLEADEATNRLADEAAEAMGATPLPVRIVSDPLGKISITIMQKKHFFITRGFELDLTDAEKSFLFAQEYAFARQPKRVNPWMVATAAVLVIAIVLPIVIGPSLALTVASLAVLTASFIPVGMTVAQTDVNKLLAADREALDVMRDPAAAMAALGKVQSGSKEAFEANIKTVWSHKILRQRTANIRARAKDSAFSSRPRVEPEPRCGE